MRNQRNSRFFFGRYAFERSNCERFVERYQNLGSLDRYHHGHGAVDRYPRQATSTDRYEKDRGGDRYAGQVEKYQAEQEDTTQVVFAAPDRRRTASKPEIFKSRDRERCEQYEHRFQQYYHDRYGYHHHHHHQQDRFPAIPCPERYKDRYRTYDSQPYHANAHNNERYLPPNAHVPVERYVPEPYHQQYHGYKQYPPVGAASPLGAANGDPYMRRDLAFHYRLPLPYASGQYQRGRYSGHPAPHPPPSVPTPQPINPASVGVAPAPSCRHAAAPGGGPSVEYVGASGGRHVCATPPPPRGGVAGVGGADAGLGVGEGCCARRTQGGVTVTVW
ncbi:unnamed protein product [Phaedon cochleariae]|uniref:Uncharacterized protein n=1 Tax=Phaedon cochleariae TaxID=80249 RepID=A0A9N9SCE8_PHACE|nr:unnamed protein product [Phaedon cochleariae]